MRLIDADALIEFIDSGHLRHPGEIAFSELDVVNMLNHMPTAYDAYKVVAQLENLLEEKTSDSGEDWYTAECLNKAIEIVKGGGIDE